MYVIGPTNREARASQRGLPPLTGDCFLEELENVNESVVANDHYIDGISNINVVQRPDGQPVEYIVTSTLTGMSTSMVPSLLMIDVHRAVSVDSGCNQAGTSNSGLVVRCLRHAAY